MKRFTSFLVALFLATAVQLWARSFQSGDLFYNTTSVKPPFTVEVIVSSSSSPYSGDIVIPDTIMHNGRVYYVQGVGDGAFSGCSTITSVVFGKHIKYIGNSAFSGCKLSKITLPDSLLSIGDMAFKNCTPLSSITLPESLTSIGEEAFRECARLTDIIIPEGVTKIAPMTFYECIHLTSVTLPDGVTSIGNNAFYDCSSLTSITLPESVTSIGSSAFSGTGITDISLPSKITSIEYNTFYGCNELQTIIIPDSITSIGASAFRNCSNLKSVTIGRNIQSFGRSCFWGCNLTTIEWNAVHADEVQYRYNNTEYYGPFNDAQSQITSFIFGDDVEIIPPYLCYGMESLTSVTLPSKVTCIGYGAFAGCKNIAGANIPDSVKCIGYEAFLDCVALTSINIPRNVTSMGQYVFRGCTNVNSIAWDAIACESSKPFCLLGNPSNVVSFTIGEGVQVIPDELCDGMTSLTDIVIPPSVVSIGANAFRNTPWYKTFFNGSPQGLVYINDVVVGYNGTMPKETKLSFRNGTVSIGGNAFKGCSNLISVDFPHTITRIDNNAFSGCSNLLAVSMSDNVKRIGSYVFDGCSKLTDINLSDGIEYIGYKAFSNCRGLQSFVFPESLKKAGFYILANCTGLNSFVWNAKCGTFVYESEYYGDEIVLSGYDEKDPLFYSDVPNITNVTLGENVEIIPCAVCARLNITSVVIPSKVKKIEDLAFYRCESLKEVVIPAGIDSIGDSAFEGCLSLTNVIFPEGLQYIGDQAFDGCEGISMVNLPQTLTHIGGGAFYETNISHIVIPKSVQNMGGAFAGCTNLTSVVWQAKNCSDFNYSPFNASNIVSFVFGDEVEHIPAYLCSKMSKLSSVTVPNSVKSIGAYAFGNCSGLTNVSLGTSVELIGDRAFSDCTQLSKVTLGEGVKNIGANAFQGCYNIISIEIPNSTKKIGDNAFNGCNKLESISLGSGLDSIGDNAFSYCDSLKSIIIPDNVTYLGRLAFQRCSSLASAVIGDGITTLNSPFWDCGVVDVTLGKNIVSVGEFYTCKKLTTITLNTIIPPTGSYIDGVLYRSGSPTVYIPCGSMSDYKANLDWRYKVNRFVEPEPDYTVSILSSDKGKGTVKFIQEIDCSNTAIFSATAKSGYAFLKWNDGNIDNPRTVKVENNESYTAIFGIPQSTDINDADALSTEGTSAVRKVFRDGQVYILREGVLYTLTGIEVK